MTGLSCENLTVERGGRTVLERVTMAVRRGEFVGLIGPNGAGKTTLLKALSGLFEPRSGSVRYESGPLPGGFERALRLAYVEQSGAAAWPVSVADLVALGRFPHRRNFRKFNALDREAILKSLEETECLGLADRRIDTLSSGERSRVLLARALAGKPEFLLADEPVAALDPAQQLAVMGLLAKIASQNVGIFAVLHDLTLASRFCHRLILLQNGRILADGPPEIVLQDQNVMRGFSIEVARGSHETLDYVLPWRRLP